MLVTRADRYEELKRVSAGLCHYSRTPAAIFLKQGEVLLLGRATQTGRQPRQVPQLARYFLSVARKISPAGCRFANIAVVFANLDFPP